MGVAASRVSLVALLALGVPVGAALLASSEAHAQQAAFADTVFELLPPGEVVGDGTTPVTLHFLALNADGSPLTGATLKATINGGKIGAVEAAGSGLYKVTWTPPRVEGARGYDLVVKGKTLDKKTVDKKWSLNTVPSLAQMVTITASPATLVLGQDSSASLNIALAGGPSQPLDGVELDVRASAGTVTNVTHLGGGKFSALYTPPAQPFPQLAVITVADRRDPTRTYGAIALPLSGKANFNVVGLPNARLIVKVADREFPPVQAGANGAAQVPLIVPPGVDKGTVTSVAGDQRKEDVLDLKVPASPRLSFLPLPKAVPADSAVPVPVRFFVATSTGQPDSSAAVALTASAGTISAPRHEGNGVYVATYTPPNNNPSAPVSLQATLTDSRGNQTGGASLTLVPTRPATVRLTAEPTTLPATGGSVKLMAKVTGPDGLGLSQRNLVFGVDGAQLQGGVKDLGNGDYQATFNSTGSGPVEVVATVTAKASGNPLRQIVVVPARDRLQNDGLSSTMLTVLTLDEFGYPVVGVPLKVSLVQGDGKVPQQGKTNDSGVSQIYYTAGRAAGLVTIKVEAGDHTGTVSLLQAPAGVATAATLPPSGSDAGLKLNAAWRNIIQTVRVERPAPAAAPVAPIATAPAWGATAAPAMAVTKLSVSSNPSSAAPGSSVELEITAADAGGKGVDGATLEFLSSQGTVGTARPVGGGRYQATLTVPADATGEIKVSVALADGSVSSFLRIPLGAAAAGGWGAPVAAAEPVWGTTPAASTAPAAAQPVAAAPAVDPNAAAAAALASAVSAPATTTTRDRTPPSDDGRPWLRASVGYSGGLYSYLQEPAAVGSPLYQGSISFGSLSDGSSPAPSSGLQVAARMWIPSARFLGVDAGLRSTYYSVQIPSAEAVIPDWVTTAHVWAVPRYRFDSGSTQMHVGARVGASIGDLMVYQQPPGSSELNYGPLAVPSLDLGAEFGAEFGEKLFAQLGYTVGLGNASTLFARDLDVGLGYAFNDHLFARLNGGTESRSTRVFLDPDSVKLEKADVGGVADHMVMFGVGLGYQL